MAGSERPTARPRRPATLLLAPVLALTAAACAPAPSHAPASLHIGAIFPLSGTTADDAGDEYLGARIAADIVNESGGIGGRQIALDLRDVEATGQVAGAVASLHSEGVPVVIGAYSSQLSIPAAAAVAHAGMVYWETGAVADQVTGPSSPLVFRVGADGADLGGNSGRFVLAELVPRLGGQARSLTAYLVTADDAYAHSVAGAARGTLSTGGVRIAGESVYDPYAPAWSPVIAGIAAQHPDILLLSSHVPDGIAFRRAFLAAGLHVQVFIGTTMAQCDAFGAALGADAVGVFASDRPEYGFNADALSGPARALFTRFTAAWWQRTGRYPTEEGISGFTAAWALFDDVLRQATRLDAGAIAVAARGIDLVSGSLPNGAGLRFSDGQNVLAAADIWQWQARHRYAVVWPAIYATGDVAMVPLPA